MLDSVAMIDHKRNWVFSWKNGRGEGDRRTGVIAVEDRTKGDIGDAKDIVAIHFDQQIGLLAKDDNHSKMKMGISVYLNQGYHTFAVVDAA